MGPGLSPLKSWEGLQSLFRPESMREAVDPEPGLWPPGVPWFEVRRSMFSVRRSSGLSGSQTAALFLTPSRQERRERTRETALHMN